MIRIEDIIRNYQEYSNGQETTSIQKAYVLAAKGQSIEGRSIQHSLEVASILSSLNLDIQSIVSGLLLESLKNEQHTLAEIRELMGDETASIVEYLLKINDISEASNEKERIAENMRQMIFATSKDIRVIFIKLADRLSEMRHIESFAPEMGKDLGNETLEIYAPIAHRLGLSHIKNEMENASFKVLHPEENEKVVQFCNRYLKDKKDFLNQLKDELETLVGNHGIQAEVKQRTKHYYSVYRKCKKNQVRYEDIYDVVATRIMVTNKAECYEVLGLIHEAYQPIGGRFKDYISTPKANGYQSLHTTVISKEHLIFEVQIRTKEMNTISEIGVAAHWAYKEGGSQKSIEQDENIVWLQELTASMGAIADPKESLELFTRELYSNSVYVFSPKGKIIKLPAGSTVIDFAYHIHSEIGNQCTGGKINGKMVSIHVKLKNGDQIEVLTSSNQSPSKDWLKSVVSTKAISRIRHELRVQENLEAEKIGKELFYEEGKKLGIKKDKLEKSEELKHIMQRGGYSTLKEFFMALGYGKFNINLLKQAFSSEKQSAPAKKTIREKISNVLLSKATESGQEGLRIAGMDNIMLRYANCCQPVKGEAVVGVISKGKGISIHLKNCEHLKKSNIETERLLDVEWTKTTTEFLPVKLQFQYDDNVKTTLNIMKVLTSNKVKLLSSNLQLKGVVTSHDIEIRVGDSTQLEKILTKCSQINTVQVTRYQGNEED